MLWAHMAKQYDFAPAILHIQAARYVPGTGAPAQTQIDSLDTLEALAAQADACLFYLGDFPRRAVPKDRVAKHLKRAWKIWGTRS